MAPCHSLAVCMGIDIKLLRQAHMIRIDLFFESCDCRKNEYCIDQSSKYFDKMNTGMNRVFEKEGNTPFGNIHNVKRLEDEYHLLFFLASIN